jgi:hypothetical protein
MKLNLIKKYNHLLIAFIIFIYLINCINNNNFNETFIIFTILIIGYLFINYNIFYIILLFIIINNLLLKFNKLNEGLTSNNGCPISPYASKLMDDINKDTAAAYQTPVVDVLDEDALTVKNASIDALSENIYNRDKDLPQITISESSADNMSKPELDIQVNDRPPIPPTCNINSSCKNLLSGSMKYDPYE